MKIINGKLISVLLVLVLVLAVFAGCSPDKSEDIEAAPPVIEEEFVPEPRETPEPDPPQEEEPEEVPDPVTYITKNNVFAFDIPYGLEIEQVDVGDNDDGEHVVITSPNGWELHVYEAIANYVGSINSYNDQMDNLVGYEDLTPIMIAGNEGCYWSEADDFFGVSVHIYFTDPATNDRNSGRWGVFWLMNDPIDGYEAADYLENPEVKAIIESIRVPE